MGIFYCNVKQFSSFLYYTTHLQGGFVQIGNLVKSMANFTTHAAW